MEPVYMMLGHAAGDAAHLAVAQMSTVQKLDVAELRRLLREERAVLDAGYQPTVRIEWTPAQPRPDEPVTFRSVATGLKDPLVHAWWDFTGTGAVAATGPEAATSFPLEKTYNVSLVVEDRAGRRRMVSVQVPVGRAIGRDITVDDTQAELFGRWGPYVPDTYTGPFARRDVILRGTTMPARARFETKLPRSGRYQVCLGFLPEQHQAAKAAVKIRHAAGLAQMTVDQRTGAGPFPFTTLGEYRFAANRATFLEIANGDAGGRVVVDAVRWVWLGE